LLPDVNIYGINTEKQLIVGASFILLNITLRIITADWGKIRNIFLTFAFSYKNNNFSFLCKSFLK